MRNMHCAFDIHVQCLFIIFMKRGAHFIEYFKKTILLQKKLTYLPVFMYRGTILNFKLKDSNSCGKKISRISILGM